MALCLAHCKGRSVAWRTRPAVVGAADLERARSAGTLPRQQEAARILSLSRAPAGTFLIPCWVAT